MDGVVRLHTVGIEFPQLTDVAMRCIREEDKLRLVVRTRPVGEAAVPVKQTEKEFRHATGVGCTAPTRILWTGELVTPPQIHETVHIALVVVLLGIARSIEGYLELRLRQVGLEIDYVVQSRGVLDLTESEPVLAVIVEVLDLVRRRIEDHRLPAHVGRLM